MEHEFKKGELIEVSNSGEYWTKRIFVTEHKSAFFTETNEYTKLDSWKYARKIEETFEKGEVVEVKDIQDTVYTRKIYSRNNNGAHHCINSLDTISMLCGDIYNETMWDIVRKYKNGSINILKS